MGYESALLYEAGRCGFKHIVITNARFKHTKPLGQSHKFYEFGASMQTLRISSSIRPKQIPEIFIDRRSNW